jgi:hypothetical protein
VSLGESGDSSGLGQLLDFLASHPTIPHVSLLLDALKDAQYGPWLPPDGLLRDLVSSYLFFSPHDSWVLQGLVEECYPRSFIPTLRFPEVARNNYEPRCFTAAIYTWLRSTKVDPISVVNQLTPLNGAFGSQIRGMEEMAKEAGIPDLRCLFSYLRYPESAEVYQQIKIHN